MFDMAIKERYICLAKKSIKKWRLQNKMTKSSIPINEKELAARWDIETIDLLYIMLTHDLNVLDQYHNKVDIEDVLEDFKKNKVILDYMFSLDEAKDIEAKLEVDGEIPHAETIRGEDLMARWQKHEGEIHSIMFTHGLDVIDPFGHELELKVIFSLIGKEVLEIPDLLFRLSNIEDLESEHPEIIPEQADDKEPEKKKRPSQIHREKCREMAEKLWDEDPTLTIVDMTYKDEINALFDGKSYVEKTIRKWIKDLNPDRSPGRRPKR
jgi:hypothetical protein